MFHGSLAGPHSLGALMGHGSPLVDDLHASRVVMLRDGKAVWGSRVLHCDQSVQQLPRPRAPSGQLQGILAFVPGGACPLLHVVLVAGRLTHHAPGVSLGLALYLGLRFRAGGSVLLWARCLQEAPVRLTPLSLLSY